MEAKKIKTLEQMMEFVWDNDPSDEVIKSIIARNKWKDWDGKEGAICSDGRRVLFWIWGCGGEDLMIDEL
jgi:hypothetical protein